MSEALYAWEQDFVSEDWAFTKDCQPLMWVRPHNGTGRDAWAVYDLEGNQVGGVSPSLESAKIQATRAAIARQDGK